MSAESRSIRIDRAEDSLTISMRTRRTGDVMHFTFGPVATLFGVVVLWIGVVNETLFDSWITVPLVIACFAYGWFTATRVVNRRVLVANSETLTVRDSPLLSFAPRVAVPTASLGTVTVREEKRWIPPIWWYQVSHVEATGASAYLFRSITRAEDATRIKAALVSFVGAARFPSEP